jgi:hypothetical protein
MGASAEESSRLRMPRASRRNMPASEPHATAGEPDDSEPAQADDTGQLDGREHSQRPPARRDGGVAGVERRAGEQRRS